MDVKETGKQIREILLLLLEGGFVMPIILTSIDRYGSIMVAEYTPMPGRKDHWDCVILAERMKSELRASPSTCTESGGFCTEHTNVVAERDVPQPNKSVNSSPQRCASVVRWCLIVRALVRR
jgi:hypothetical protein